MSYTGFFADEDLYEVAKAGDPDEDGTWVVPVAKADDYPTRSFVEREDRGRRTVEPRAPRARAPSCSACRAATASARPRTTPRRCSPAASSTHALAELLDQDGETTHRRPTARPRRSASRRSGSGAFLNEAINQLAGGVPAGARQAELGETIDPEQYPAELQKVKAHFALHQCYGVDLNADRGRARRGLALAQRHAPGLRAPWFGLHLRRGNSLIGARRETYARRELAQDGGWLTAPCPRTARCGTAVCAGRGAPLPAAGRRVGCGGRDEGGQGGRAERRQALKTWRKGVTAVPAQDRGDPRCRRSPSGSRRCGRSR